MRNTSGTRQEHVVQLMSETSFSVVLVNTVQFHVSAVNPQLQAVILCEHDFMINTTRPLCWFQCGFYLLEHDMNVKKTESGTP